MNRWLKKILLTSAVFIPAAAMAQAPAPVMAPGNPTGTPGGVAMMKSQNSQGFPTPSLIPGKPIETRSPEKSDDQPAFAGQTRAPDEPTVPVNVTVMTDQLKSPWAMAFLPDGGILITEKPGTMRNPQGWQTVGPDRRRTHRSAHRPGGASGCGSGPQIQEQPPHLLFL